MVLETGGLVQAGPLTGFPTNRARECTDAEARVSFPLARMRDYVILLLTYDNLTYPRETYT